MGVKIVFNGTEYDGVAAMPPAVRKAYEAALESLGKGGGGVEGLASLLNQGLRTSIKATFREVVVNGKKYGSIDEMPPDIRQTYEEAMASLAPGEAAGPGGPGGPAAPPPRAVPSPPILEEDGARRGGLFRILLWMAIGALIAVWVLRHR